MRIKIPRKPKVYGSLKAYRRAQAARYANKPLPENQSVDTRTGVATVKGIEVRPNNSVKNPRFGQVTEDGKPEPMFLIAPMDQTVVAMKKVREGEESPFKPVVVKVQKQFSPAERALLRELGK